MQRVCVVKTRKQIFITINIDETPRCQLCHYNVVVAQLAALGFIKSV
jgi:hypothetical protein